MQFGALVLLITIIGLICSIGVVTIVVMACLKYLKSDTQ